MSSLVFVHRISGSQQVLATDTHLSEMHNVDVKQTD